MKDRQHEGQRGRLLHIMISFRNFSYHSAGLVYDARLSVTVQTTGYKTAERKQKFTSIFHRTDVNLLP